MINIYKNIESFLDTAKRSLRPGLIYLFLVDLHLQPALISNKSPAISFQSGVDAATDVILCVPYPTRMKILLRRGFRR